MTLVVLLLLAAPPAPVAGRPADFSGAIGGPFTVRYELATDAVLVEQPFEVTLAIRGDGDLSQVRAPALAWPTGLVADLTESAPGRFKYRVRAATPGTFSLPRWKFVSYQPALRGWQTTYSEPAGLTVRPRPPTTSPIPPDLATWADEALATGADAEFSLPATVWLIPPVLALASLAFPRSFIVRRRALRMLNRDDGEPARTIAAAVERFARDARLPANATAGLLAEIDRVRFGPPATADLADLRERARAFITEARCP